MTDLHANINGDISKEDMLRLCVMCIGNTSPETGFAQMLIDAQTFYETRCTCYHIPIPN
jgi:hypothetical protein